MTKYINVNNRTFWLDKNLGYIYDKLKTNLEKSQDNLKIFQESGDNIKQLI